jgi:hypothetical protein
VNKHYENLPEDTGISLMFLQTQEKIRGIIEGMQIDYSSLSDERKMLIVCIAQWNISIESAAFFLILLLSKI